MFVYDLKSLWCERERAKLRLFLNLLELGKVGTHEGTTDTTDATKKEVKESIAECDTSEPPGDSRAIMVSQSLGPLDIEP